MAKCLPLSIQKHVLANINRSCPSDLWLYGLSTQWMVDFNQQLKSQSDDLSSTEMACPALTVDLKMENNEFISEKWWKILVSWYGLDKNSTVIRHPISSIYVPITVDYIQHMVLSNKETDFVSLSVCLLENFEKESLHKRITMYAWDTFDFLEYQIRRLFEISPKCRSRLWINIQENCNDVILDNVDNCSRPILAEIVTHLPWLSKKLLNRGQSSGSMANMATDPFWFVENSIKVLIAFEITSFDLKCHTSREGWTRHAFDLEGDSSSIVTLATINGRWEELFTDCLDEFMKEVSDIATSKLGISINMAKDIVCEKISQTEKLKADMEEKLKNLDQKEKILNEIEAELTEKENDYNKKLVQYKDGLHSFMKEKNRLELEWKKVHEQNLIKDSKITLNIGGERYTTSLTTLTNIEDSLFVHLFCGTHVVEPSEDGSYFMDRDGTHFRHILNYLRNGPKTVNSIPNQKTVLIEILNEAKYYRLSELEKLIQDKIDNRQLSTET